MTEKCLLYAVHLHQHSEMYSIQQTFFNFLTLILFLSQIYTSMMSPVWHISFPAYCPKTEYLWPTCRSGSDTCNRRCSSPWSWFWNHQTLKHYPQDPWNKTEIISNFNYFLTPTQPWFRMLNPLWVFSILTS